jgi:site-specific DNA-methyltransferase (adenine-specific)
MTELLKGDCLELMQQIPDGSVDAIICDPPYGTTACKWDSVIPFDLMWGQLNRIIKPNGAIVLFGSEPFSSALRMSNIKNYKYDITWNKIAISNPMMSKKQPLRCVENICIFYKKQPTYNPQMQEGKKWHRGGKKEHTTGTLGSSILVNNGSDKTSLKYPKNLIDFSNANKTGNQHPTQKPVELMEYLIKTYTNEGETVLDFTMGSGSTGVAAMNTYRNFIGIEMAQSYFDIATKRIEEAQEFNNLI